MKYMINYIIVNRTYSLPEKAEKFDNDRELQTASINNWEEKNGLLTSKNANQHNKRHVK